MQAEIMDDPVMFNLGNPFVQEKFIPLIDLLLVAFVVAGGGSGGLAAAGFESIKTKQLPKASTLQLSFGVGAIGAVITFSAAGLSSFVLPDGAVDVLRLLGFSALGGFFVSATAMGINIKVLRTFLGQGTPDGSKE